MCLIALCFSPKDLLWSCEVMYSESYDLACRSEFSVQTSVFGGFVPLYIPLIKLGGRFYFLSLSH